MAELMKMMKEWLGQLTGNLVAWLGAAAGLVLGLWAGLPELARAVLVVQAADIATGLACALLGRSEKSESGRLSSRAMLEGAIRKGAEWLIVLVCAYAGAPLGMQGIAPAAMTYVIAAELVSLLENLSLLGLSSPALESILDVAHGKRLTAAPNEERLTANEAPDGE